MRVKIEPSWKKILVDEFEKPDFENLTAFVRNEYQTKIVYPPPKLIFNAFELCPFDDVRVVILGQDPYHGSRQAHGLCFSVPDGISMPPSLKNIYKEINNDLNLPMPQSGNLEHWARQGVLLLNATLTVRANSPASHQRKGWEEFTDAVIEKLSSEKEGLIFLLWGRYAQEKGRIIDESKHVVLKAAHPSPYSATAGFFGCRHFSKTNDYLVSRGKNSIQWVSEN